MTTGDGRPGLLVAGTDQHPAQVRFTITLTIAGRLLSTVGLADALAEHLTHRFNIVDLEIDPGTVLEGRTVP